LVFRWFLELEMDKKVRIISIILFSLFVWIIGLFVVKFITYLPI